MDGDNACPLTWEEAAELWRSWGGKVGANSLDVPSDFPSDDTWFALARSGNAYTSKAPQEPDANEEITRDLLEELAECWGLTPTEAK